MDDKKIELTFWGVRGSRPNPSKYTLKYGGNTPCLSIKYDGKMYIFDAGTGIINLGKYMLEQKIYKAKIFFTHEHWDHIQGLPFFPLLYYPETGIELDLYGEDKYDRRFEDIIKLQMSAPYFPYDLENLNYRVNYHSVDLSEKLKFSDVEIEYCRLNHPDYCLAYKFTSQGRSVVYATDTEMMSGMTRENFIEFANDVDVLIYDAQYTIDEYYGNFGNSPRKGFGHSTYEEALQIADQTHAKSLYLFHHDDGRKDEDLDAIISKIRRKRDNVYMAMEDLTIRI